MSQPVFTPFIMISQEEKLSGSPEGHKPTQITGCPEKNKPPSSRVPVSPHTQQPEKVLLETGDKSGLLLTQHDSAPAAPEIWLPGTVKHLDHWERKKKKKTFITAIPQP